MTPSFLLLTLLALAVYRLTRLVTRDVITDSFRDWLQSRLPEETVAYRHRPPRRYEPHPVTTQVHTTAPDEPEPPAWLNPPVNMSLPPPGVVPPTTVRPTLDANAAPGPTVYLPPPTEWLAYRPSPHGERWQELTVCPHCMSVHLTVLTFLPLAIIRLTTGSTWLADIYVFYLILPLAVMGLVSLLADVAIWLEETNE